MIDHPCAPEYSYRPTNFTASDTKCVAPTYAEHRGRLFAGNTFFRSKNQGPDENLISIECLSAPTPQVNVYNNGVLVETYPISLETPGSIANLRVQVTTNTNSIIEMLELDEDVYDTRDEELDDVDVDNPLTPYGLMTFSNTFLSGGEGGPTTDAGLELIRTGPERTIFILRTTEDYNGNDVTPPAARRVQQWDGVEWISYCNLIPGDCPLDGGC